MSAYVVGFAVTTAVMVCEGLFGSSAVWFMFKSVGKRFRILNFQFDTDIYLCCGINDTVSFILNYGL